MHVSTYLVTALGRKLSAIFPVSSSLYHKCGVHTCKKVTVKQTFVIKLKQSKKTLFQVRCEPQIKIQKDLKTHQSNILGIKSCLHKMYRWIGPDNYQETSRGIYRCNHHVSSTNGTQQELFE